MTWDMKKQGKHYTIYGEGYSFTINNHHDAQKLLTLLNNKTTKEIQTETTRTLDNIKRDIINLQMTVKILSDEVDDMIQKVIKQ